MRKTLWGEFILISSKRRPAGVLKFILSTAPCRLEQDGQVQLLFAAPGRLSDYMGYFTGYMLKKVSFI